MRPRMLGTTAVNRCTSMTRELLGDVGVALHEKQRAIVLGTSRCQQKELPKIASRDDD